MSKLKKIFLYLLSIGLPWLTLIIIEETIPAIFVFFLQLTVIGWIPAVIWTMVLLKKHLKTIAASTPPPQAEHE